MSVRPCELTEHGASRAAVHSCPAVEVKARVLFVDHVAVLGGAELALLDMAHAYRTTSAVAVLAMDGPLLQRLDALGVRVHTLDGAVLQRVRRSSRLPTLSALRAVWQLSRDLARLARQYDVLFANSQKAMIVSSLAGLLAKRPVVWDLHDLMSPDHFSAANRRIGVTLGNHVAVQIITNSAASAAAYVASGGVSHKLRVVHNGIAAQPFAEVSVEQTAQARRALEIGDAPVVAMFGRLSPWKGQHVLLDAMARLPGVRAMVVGDAMFGEQAYAHALSARATGLGIADRISFLGARDDVPCLMSVADVVVHASIAPEPFGRVVVEGMLAARPVVATRGGGVAEIVDDGVTGRLVPPNDPVRLAAVIAEVLAEPARGRAMGLRAREHATTRFSPDMMVARKSRCIEEVAATRRVASRRLAAA